MKAMIKDLNDKASNYLDTQGLANPVEVINEGLGGETREESKVRREKAKEVKKPPEPVKKAKGGQVEHYDMSKDKTMMKKVADTEAAKMVKAHEKKMHKMSSGGSASSRADGCAQRGKTRA